MACASVLDVERTISAGCSADICDPYDLPQTIIVQNAAQHASHSVYMQDMFLTHIVNVSNLYRTIQKYLENFQCISRPKNKDKKYLRTERKILHICD